MCKCLSRFFIKNKNAVHTYDTILNVFTRDIAVFAFPSYPKLKQQLAL